MVISNLVRSRRIDVMRWFVTCWTYDVSPSHKWSGTPVDQHIPLNRKVSSEVVRSTMYSYSLTVAATLNELAWMVVSHAHGPTIVPGHLN